MPSHTGEKPEKLLSFNIGTLEDKHCRHISVKESLLEKHKYRLACLPEKVSFDTLFQRFVVEIEKTIPCDGIDYCLSDNALCFSIGDVAGYQCCYQLRYLSLDIGRIIFSRKKSYSDAEMQTLEMMLSGLIKPLHRVVKHYKLRRHLYGLKIVSDSNTLANMRSITVAGSCLAKES